MGLSFLTNVYTFISCGGVGYTISKNTFLKSSNKDRSSFPFRTSINLDLTMTLVKSSIFSSSSRMRFPNS